jgi:hypothetical protein
VKHRRRPGRPDFWPPVLQDGEPDGRGARPLGFAPVYPWPANCRPRAPLPDDAPHGRGRPDPPPAGVARVRSGRQSPRREGGGRRTFRAPRCAVGSQPRIPRSGRQITEHVRGPPKRHAGLRYPVTRDHPDPQPAGPHEKAERPFPTLVHAVGMHAAGCPEMAGTASRSSPGAGARSHLPLGGSPGRPGIGGLRHAPPARLSANP